MPAVSDVKVRVRNVTVRELGAALYLRAFILKQTSKTLSEDQILFVISHDSSSLHHLIIRLNPKEFHSFRLVLVRLTESTCRSIKIRNALFIFEN